MLPPFNIVHTKEIHTKQKRKKDKGVIERITKTQSCITETGDALGEKVELHVWCDTYGGLVYC